MNSRQREDEDEETSAKTKAQGRREEETSAIGLPQSGVGGCGGPAPKKKMNT